MNNLNSENVLKKMNTIFLGKAFKKIRIRVRRKVNIRIRDWIRVRIKIKSLLAVVNLRLTPFQKLLDHMSLQ